jgi:two-component system, response regulator PdtaR
MDKDLSILIVEDEVLTADELRDQLQQLGFGNVAHARDSQAALALVKEHTFDLAIIDIQLASSDLNGIKLAQLLQKKQHLPVILASSFSDSDTVKEIVSNIPGAEFIVKPIALRQLYVDISRVLQNACSTGKAASSPLAADMVFIKGNDNYYNRVHIHDILYVKADGSGIMIYTANGRAYFNSSSLSSFITQFRHPDIVRIHRSYAVNIKHVISRGKKMVKMGNGDILPISSTYQDDADRLLVQIKSD